MMAMSMLRITIYVMNVWPKKNRIERKFSTAIQTGDR